MKKLVFTAIGLIAFSGISMASNVLENSSYSKKSIAVDCETIATKNANQQENRIHSAYGFCFTSSQYNAVRGTFLAACIRLCQPVYVPYIDDTPIDIPLINLL